MSRRLVGLSFHSVKGGVGKSALATLAAVRVARRWHLPTCLIDMDLTGTSLADVLPLEAPAWGPVEDTEEEIQTPRLDLLVPPTGYHSRMESRRLIEERGEHGADEGPVGVPFLNDFLLWTPLDRDDPKDLHPRSLFWRFENRPEALHVLPSSALPADLDRILPVIFAEEYSAFLESRMEYALDRLVPEDGCGVVVMDTPPTIPGLSRSVLSLALRLGSEPKQPLSEGGYIPPRLEETPVSWRACLVTTLDRQDLRAAARWLARVRKEEAEQVQVVINRAVEADPGQRQKLLEDILVDLVEPNQLLNEPLWIPERKDLQIFRTEGLPDDDTLLDELLTELLGPPP